MKYALKKPIQNGSELVTMLTFREDLCAGDLRGVPMRSPMLWEDMLKIAGRLCAQPDSVMNAMSFEDLTEVTGMVAGFMNGGQQTGTAP